MVGKMFQRLIEPSGGVGDGSHERLVHALVEKPDPAYRIVHPLVECSALIDRAACRDAVQSEALAQPGVVKIQGRARDIRVGAQHRGAEIVGLEPPDQGSKFGLDGDPQSAAEGQSLDRSQVPALKQCRKVDELLTKRLEPAQALQLCRRRRRIGGVGCRIAGTRCQVSLLQKVLPPPAMVLAGDPRDRDADVRLHERPPCAQ